MSSGLTDRQEAERERGKGEPEVPGILCTANHKLNIKI